MQPLRITDLQADTLRSLLEKNCSPLAGRIGPKRFLAPEEAVAIIDILTDELTSQGIDQKGEVTPIGEAIDELIGLVSQTQW